MQNPSHWCYVAVRTVIVSVALLATPVLPANTPGIKDHIRIQETTALLRLWLEAKRDYESLPGLSAAVVYDQEVLWSGGFGYADPVRKIAATDDTIYGICSISKLFTSIAVMKLRDSGELRLDDVVSDLIPDFSVNQAFADSGPVTVEGLLTHTAGLPAEVNAPISTGPNFDFPTHEELFRLQAEQETMFPASTHYEYSNLGISLAGEIVSHLSGISFEDYVKREIFDPLGLNSTWARLPEQEVGKRMAVGHSARRRDGSRSEVQLYQARGYTPAIGLASTVSDVATFASWQFRVLKNDDDRIISANTLREMYQPHFVLPGWESAQGLGFEVDLINDKVYVGHSGICPGFVSRLQIDPNNRIAVILMVNANNVDIWNITTKMHEIMAPAIEVATKSSVVRALDDTEFNAGDEEVPHLSDYIGLYDAWPWNADTAFISWEGHLAALRLSSNNPVQDLRHWKHIEGDVFRRIRSDGLLAETWTFERDSFGAVHRVNVYGDYMRKIR